MKKFKVVIENVVATDDYVTAAKLARLWKREWYLDAGDGAFQDGENPVPLKHGKFTVTATELKK